MSIARLVLEEPRTTFAVLHVTVWLEITNLHMNGPKKLQMKQTGPFEIEEVISCTAFRLCIPPWWKIHPVFHASLLMTYREMSEHGPNFL